ncbi:Na+/H+ antiporter NhaC [Bacillus thermotolerans]|uniref:Tyrosine transporter, NhaC family n=1 Tax=Bacillus thermotolerans TaxID=1221996 RepID=A0A0F5I1Y8_BACTR|nr:Na+/H+ antiporter NhaC [Bacillus thermotolerans]KKB39152.1 putative tyrosine transporter, NhaC family [Bacillus thermotolerans]KKB42543.1 putative tyrosine transporter, NhaC family [Bacillus thermotolerans]KKB42772.1 putative tyrosine transporter, NhaC family [Bacillus thermotolerans]
MFKIEPKIKPSLFEALLITVIILLLISFSIIQLESVPHIPILLSVLLLWLFGALKRVPLKIMENGMLEGAKGGIGAVFIFFLIGVLISSWIMSGTIPTMMYAAFELVTPNWFYSVVFLITAVIGLGIGSSLTTVATLGMAFIGVGEAVDASSAIIAGAVVSGAFFGDKMSPLSDTTNLAASVVGVDLFTHIRNMGWTTIPVFIITLILFAFISPDISGAEFPEVKTMQAVLTDEGLVHWYSWLPLLLLFFLSIKKVSPFVTLAASAVFGVLLSFLHSDRPLAEVGSVLFSGFVSKTGNAEVDALLTRGGMDSMMFTVSLVLLSLSLGGLLFSLGIIPRLFVAIEQYLKKVSSTVTAAAASAIGVNLVIGEQYLSILLTGEAFQRQFEKVGLARKNLARTLEDAGTVINPLVPWGVCGVFITTTLGIPTLSYLPFAFFCLLSPIATIIYGFTGWTLTKKENE